MRNWIKETVNEYSRIISSSWIKKYNSVTYYTTDKNALLQFVGLQIVVCISVLNRSAELRVFMLHIRCISE